MVSMSLARAADALFAGDFLKKGGQDDRRQVIAESILNRLVVGAEIITLEGPNMRLDANQ